MSIVGLNEIADGRIPARGFESPDQQAMVEAVDALCRRHMTEAYLRSCDRDSRYPEEAMRRLADAGWAGLAVPEAYGGVGGSARDLAVVHRAIAAHGLAPAQAYFSLWTLGADAISRLGTDEQKAHWLPRIAAGEARVAFALTEPGAGSDAGALQTRAEHESGSFRVSGQKVFITGAAVADVIITAARTAEAVPGRRGISLLLVDPRADGVSLRKLDKIGLRSLDLCEVFLDAVEVPETDVLGPLHGGWEVLRHGLALERTLVGAICVGAMSQLLDLSVEYARERTAFGQPIGSFQLVAARLVRLRVALECADLLVARAAAAIDEGRPNAATLAAVAKLQATEAYVSATRDATQVFGGYGFTEEYVVGRHYRDAKYLEIGGGTSEIQTMIIARSMGLG